MAKFIVRVVLYEKTELDRFNYAESELFQSEY